MIVFFPLAAVLVAASLLFVLIPLWRARRPVSGKRREANITVYRQRCEEIEREVAAERMSRADADAARDELGARLLDDLDNAPAAMKSARGAPRRTRPWLVSALTVLVLGVGSAAVYWQIGDFQAIRDAGMPDVDTMIARLEQQVAQSPDDLPARAMLARAQQATGNYAQAAANYAAINAALPKPRAPVLAAQAQATLQATDDLQGKARGLFRQLLSLEADNREALWYLGLAAAERGDNVAAAKYWDRLLAQDLPKDVAEQVRNRRDELSGHKPELPGK